MSPRVAQHVLHQGIGAVIGSLIAYASFGSSASDPLFVLVVGGAVGVLASAFYRSVRESRSR